MSDVLKHTGLTLAGITLFFAINMVSIALMTWLAAQPGTEFLSGQIIGTVVFYLLWYRVVRAGKPRLLAVQNYLFAWILIASFGFIGVLSGSTDGMLGAVTIVGGLNTLWLIGSLVWPGKGKRRYGLPVATA